MTDHVDIFEEIARLRREGTPAALATIVGTRGSTPGQETMRLLVLEDGTFLGTVGGGCLEAEVYEAAKEVIRDEHPRTLTFRLTKHDSPDSGLLCGGEVTIFIESITTPRLTVFGGGHVSKALVRIAAMAGFRVTVADDRATYARRDRFPEAADVVCQDYVKTVAEMSMQANSYAVIVTRGHKEDGVVLEAFARRWEQGSQLKFLGMIGSKTKKAVLFRHLKEAGVAAEFLQTVRSPVGLCLGARNHEEIAVAVVAELISVRRLGQDADQAWRDRPSRQARAGSRVGPVEIELAEDQNALGEAGSAAS
ncbi:MAG: XdhC family protein [Planctomycetota bacterium]|jgi:xanthine dehydrogenase accessory factor